MYIQLNSLGAEYKGYVSLPFSMTISKQNMWSTIETGNLEQVLSLI